MRALTTKLHHGQVAQTNSYHCGTSAGRGFSPRILTVLPRAAAMYREQIAKGLDGDPRAAMKARVLLKDLFGGRFD